jgi:antitoxin HigA-1
MAISMPSKLPIIINEHIMIPKNHRPSHPGEILLELYLKPMGMSQLELARRMGVPIQRVNTIINEKRDMSPETAILLSKVLKTTSQCRMNLQVNCDLYDAQKRLDHAA